MCWWCSWWSARGCQGFHKEMWWEWDQVHKTWQMHCWLFLRQIHQWQTQKLARDFQRKRYQGKQLGLEEEKKFWWCGFSQGSNQKRHSEGCQSQMLKEEVKICFCRGWCWSFERAVYSVLGHRVCVNRLHCQYTLSLATLYQVTECVSIGYTASTHFL